VEEEHEYLPLPKYPSVMRDISILIEPTIRVAEIMQAIQLTHKTPIPRGSDQRLIRRSLADQRKSALSPRKSALVEDVDLIDEYDVASKRGLTFRIIFQAEDRTLTDKEVNKEMEKITKMLKSKFRAIIR
jgi:phenylalanyl-tRNA synthetase beta chain